MDILDEDSLRRGSGNLTIGRRRTREEVSRFAKATRPTDTQSPPVTVMAGPSRSGPAEGQVRFGVTPHMSSQAASAPPSARRRRELDPLLPDPNNAMSTQSWPQAPLSLQSNPKRRARAPLSCPGSISGFDQAAISGGDSAKESWREVDEGASINVPQRGDNDMVESGEGRARPRDDGKPFSWMQKVEASPSDIYLSRARKRNADRLLLANERDEEILGKYLPDDLEAWFSVRIEGPEDSERSPQGWVESVMEVARTPCPVPEAPLAHFSTSRDALLANTNLLKDCNWDMCEFFKKHENTTAGRGSEFRPVSQLKPIVGRHKNFGFLQRMLEDGFEYFLTRSLSEDERKAEFEAQWDRGNHQSAVSSEGEVRGLLEGDVTHGFALPILAACLGSVRGVLLQPGGMVRQMSLKADGTRKLKTRFTHDLSFAITAEDASVNARVEMGRYPDMIYGWCLSRILHYLACLRFRNPGIRIFISKFDFSDAYKRICHSPEAAASTVVRFGDIAYIFLRMVFGGAPNPAGFSCFSEMLTDLANELSSSSLEMAECEEILKGEIPRGIKESQDPDVKVERAILPAFTLDASKESYKDCFIDDIINCYLDTPRNQEREGGIVPLAVQVMSRPHSGEANEPVPRKPLLSPEKLEAEGRGSESQVVLGWEIATRSFEVRLPLDKYLAWKEDVERVITQDGKGTSQQELESIVGRLNHASHVIPMSRHFLNELRAKCLSVPRKKAQGVRLAKEEFKDLKLWLDFLEAARSGISINLLVERTPTRIAWSDSCPFGLGGYTLRGRAWRIRVPPGCHGRGDDSVNNVLEFLGMAISVMTLLVEASEEGEEFPCLLVLGDNTSAIAWLHRSSQLAKSSRYYRIVKMIARRLAEEVIKAKAKLCSQHIAGDRNKIADLLSFEGRDRGKIEPLTVDCPPNEVLTERIHRFHSQLVPAGFKIQQLPIEIESFAFSVMRIVSQSWSPKERLRTQGGKDIGEGGSVLSEIGDWETTPSSIQYAQKPSDCYWQEGSPPPSEISTSTHRAELLRSVRSQWYQRLFETPLAVWHRRSGTISGKVPSTSRTTSLVQDNPAL